MEYKKTYTHQLIDLRQTIIAEIKGYMKKNFDMGSLDIKENFIMCENYMGEGFLIEEVSVKGLKIKKGEKRYNVKFDALYTDDLRRLHSLLVTGCEHL